MTDQYKAFVREFKRRAIEYNMGPKQIAEMMGRSPVTVYSWLRYETIMSGEDMIRIITLLMGGRYEKR
jgi:uncharacterized protein YjcR